MARPKGSSNLKQSNSNDANGLNVRLMAHVEKLSIDELIILQHDVAERISEGKEAKIKELEEQLKVLKGL